MTEPGAPPPAAAAADKPPGQFGEFLKAHGIKSERLADSTGVETIAVDPKDLEQALKRLRNSAEIGLDCLVCVSGTESQSTFDSVYHLWSYTDPAKELVIKVLILKESVHGDRLPVVPSITPFWQAANWHERETYDLVGIKYAGHPYLRRILNPWDWDGHPLRRDYKQPVDALNDRNPHSMR